MFSITMVEGQQTYFANFQPFTKSSRLNSPIDGDFSISAIARQTISSSFTLMSPRYFIAPSMPMSSGLSLGASTIVVSDT